MGQIFNNGHQFLNVDVELSSNNNTLPQETIDRLVRLISEVNPNNYFMNLAAIPLEFDDPNKEDCWALSLLSDQGYTEHSILPLSDHEEALTSFEEVVKNYYQFRDNLSQLPVLTNDGNDQVMWMLDKEDGSFSISIYERDYTRTWTMHDQVLIDQPEDLFNEDVKQSLINLQVKFDKLIDEHSNKKVVPDELTPSDLDDLSLKPMVL